MESDQAFFFLIEVNFAWPKCYENIPVIDSIYYTGARKATLQIQSIVWLDWYLQELYTIKNLSRQVLQVLCGRCNVLLLRTLKENVIWRAKSNAGFQKKNFFLLDPLWSGPPVTVSKCRMLMTWSPENSQLFTASHFSHARQHWDHGSNTWPPILVIYDP